MLDDIRRSAHLLRHSPMFTLAAVSTLAIAIGANTAVFSLVDGLLLRPLPIESPDRVAVIWPRERARPTTIGEIAYSTYRSWEGQVRSFERLATMGSTNWSLVLQEGEPVTVPAAAVSSSFFPLLGARAALGRTPLPAEDARGVPRVAVLSHASWKNRFSADPAIVGRTLRFKDAPYTVVGVMPEGFDYPRGVELWVPVVPQLVDASAKWDIDVVGDPGFGMLFVLGRLKDGVTPDAARDEVTTLITGGAGTTFRPGMEAALTPLDEHIFGATRPALIALAVCVGLVLLIGCANVAALFLARADGHAHETAVRLALGATRWRIVRQSLTDALLLACLGGAAGVALAFWALDAFVALAPANAPRLDAIGFDLRTCAFAWVACLVAALLAGLGPGLHSSRWTLASTLGRGTSRVTRSRLARRTLVVVQAGLAVVLLACAGLVGRSFLNLVRLDVGFNPVNVLTLDVVLPDAAPTRYNQFYTEFLAKVGRIPGVEAVGAIYQRPLEHSGIGMDATILIEGQRTDLRLKDWEQNPMVNFEAVTPGYFKAVGTRIVRGRGFADTDTAEAARVAIVSQGLARRLWAGQDPIGRRIHAPGVVPAADLAIQQRWPVVIGVVDDARYRGLVDARFDLYVPYLQHDGLLVKHLMVRTAGNPLAFTQAIRREAKAIEPGVLVENVSTMAHLTDRAVGPWRFGAWALGVLGVIALALAALGVYAIANQSVVERTREIGVRVAAGARPAQIARLVLRDGLGLTATGMAIGLAGAVSAGYVLTSLLYGVQPYDWPTLAGMAALFIAVSTVAMLRPALRAARVDPVVALREQ